MSEPSPSLIVPQGAYSIDQLLALASEEALEHADAERLRLTPPWILGEVLSRLEVAEVRTLLRVIPLDHAAEAVAEMDNEVAAEVVEAMREARAIQLLEELDADDRADIVGQMDPPDRERLLRRFDPETASQIRELMAYAPESAGGIMNPDVATIRPDATVKEAIKAIRRMGNEIEYIPYVYVTDEAERLLGVVSMRSLVFAGPRQPLSEIMEVDLTGVCQVDLDQEEVARRMAEVNLHSLPVVDHEGRLLGIVTHDDILDVIRQEATEDVQKMVGAGGDEQLHDPVAESVQRRLPWLVVNLLTAALAGLVVSVFEEQIATMTILAVCMPIVANLGGNAGAQTLAVVIRSLALHDLHLGDARGVLWREGLKGLTNGAFVGALAALAVGLFAHSLGVALVMFAAMILSMGYAGAAGAIIPILLRKLGQDPAQSSSIFVTATTDIFGFGVFLGMAAWWLQ